VAVVQISRIQVRRGQKNIGTGVPQLSSGEFGWAVDTRELYIGNGPVSEGAPQVGNTKVLTQYDDIFSVADTYIYKNDSGILITGATPVQRSLQDRLDDRVSIRAFGVVGDGTTNVTSQLQTAIDQLYLNTSNGGLPQSRVVLHLEAGEYLISDTIYIPPYATLVGAGSDKTIIKCSTTIGEIFKTVNADSIIGSPATKASTTTLNQPSNITIKGITIDTTATGNKGLVLDCCKDSYFEDMKIKGPWSTSDTISTSEVAVELNNLSLVSSVVETKNNTFKNVTLDGFSYAVSSDWDTNNNIWTDCDFNSLGYGVAFGINLISLDPGLYSSKNYGPYNNIFEKSRFSNIDKQAIWIKFGEWNNSISNKFNSCGCDGGAEYQSQHSIIKYETSTNGSDKDYFARTKELSYTPAYWISYDYVPEIEGSVNCEFGERHVLNTIGYTGLNVDSEPIYAKTFRLPAEQDVANQTYEIDYIITSRTYAAHRAGTLTINCDGYNKTVAVSDEHTFIGAGSDLYLDKIYFDATLETFFGEVSVIDVKISNQMPSDDASQIEYKVKLKKTRIDASGE